MTLESSVPGGGGTESAHIRRPGLFSLRKSHWANCGRGEVECGRQRVKISVKGQGLQGPGGDWPQNPRILITGHAFSVLSTRGVT